MLEATPLKSDLVFLLVSADKTLNRDAPGAHWEPWFTDFLPRRYRLGDDGLIRS